MQTLVDEVHLLREENIKISSEFAQNQNFFNQVLHILYDRIANKNLTYYTQRLASISSAEFIIKNMNTAQIFGNPMEHLKYALDQIEIEGLIFEFGVFQGNTINFISTVKSDKIIYGFDSFEGLPSDWRSGFPKGHFNLNDILPTVNANVRLIKGWFNETLPNFLKEHKEKCAFIHIDCDLYSSTETVFLELKDRITRGTIIVFDEYFNYPGWEEGEHKAFTEFVEKNHIQFDYISYNANAEQVAVKIK